MMHLDVPSIEGESDESFVSRITSLLSRNGVDLSTLSPLSGGDGVETHPVDVTFDFKFQHHLRAGEVHEG